MQDNLLTQSCVTHSFLEASAFVLFRPCDLLLEHMSGSKRPVGIAQEFASQQGYVSLPGGDDVREHAKLWGGVSWADEMDNEVGS